MNDEAKRARNAYNREYYAKNKERRKEYTRHYWERKAAEKAQKGPNTATSQEQK